MTSKTAKACDLFLKRFGPDTQLTVAAVFLIPILLHPGFPTLPRRGVPSRKSKAGDFRIRNLDPLIGIFWQNSHKRIGKRRARNSIKQVSLYGTPIFTTYRDVPAIVKRLFQRFTQVFFLGERGNPSLQRFVHRSRRYFQLVGVQGVPGNVGMAWSGHARVSSRFFAAVSWICTSGLYE